MNCALGRNSDIKMFEFNEDGSMKIPDALGNVRREKDSDNFSSNSNESNKEDRDYLFILKGIDEISFSVGRKLLIDFLRGISSNESIKRNRLDRLMTFGILAYDEAELEAMIDSLVKTKLIEYVPLPNNKFIRVLKLTNRGNEEIYEPGKYYKKVSSDYIHHTTKITDEDKQKFNALGEFVAKFNDEQKKAIISNSKNILCVAGAGSGKTTVLTKRIEFLSKYRGVNANKILAITFTRKARTEMQERLNAIGGLNNVEIQTFNSFCEKILRRYGDKIYDKPMRVVEYKDKITMINTALNVLGTDMQNAILTYFTIGQRKLKTKEQLANIFMNDCFFVRDYMKSKNEKLELESFSVDNQYKRAAELIFGVCNFIDAYMVKNGLRDFTDQMIDTLRLFNSNKELIPEFEHILIDEYQDVNATQIDFVDILSPKNLFCVGDPRQSIYGWRGSDIRYILKFQNKYKDSEIISLVKNYRSGEKIVDLFNASIKDMKLPDLESGNLSISKEDTDIRLLNFKTENDEYFFIINAIKKSIDTGINPKDIFVLARTNKQLIELGELLREQQIQCTLRSDEMKKVKDEDVKGITLATVHAIKGLEADTVFVIGCNKKNFPCKGSEHPVVEMIKIDEYDKMEEEKRLFYVALSRAKKKLYLTYTGNSTYFITPNMLKIIHGTTAVKVSDDDLVTRIKEWRLKTAKEMDVPAFMILNDKTMFEIVAMHPMVMEELHMIKGIGPNTITRFGNAILDLINK